MARISKKAAIKVYSSVVPGYSHWAAPVDITEGDVMKVPHEGDWVCTAVREGVVQFKDTKRQCNRYLRIYNSNMQKWDKDLHE